MKFTYHIQIIHKETGVITGHHVHETDEPFESIIKALIGKNDPFEFFGAQVVPVYKN